MLLCNYAIYIMFLPSFESWMEDLAPIYIKIGQMEDDHLSAGVYLYMYPTFLVLF